MEVKRYVYQSPYNSPVQFGRPDPSSQQQSQDTKLTQENNQTLRQAQQTQQSMQQEVTPKVNEARLDVYA